jgi:hypothetical protein
VTGSRKPHDRSEDVSILCVGSVTMASSPRWATGIEASILTPERPSAAPNLDSTIRDRNSTPIGPFGVAGISMGSQGRIP